MASLTEDGALTAARRVAADLATRAERHDREGSYAPENTAAIWAAGLGSLTISAEAGGAGAGLAPAARVVEALAAGDASSALILVMHLLQMRAITAPDSPWPAGLQRRLVADSLAGPALVNALRVEPELGTPARGGVPATRAVRHGAGWRLAGHKIYSTGSLGLRWMVVFAAAEGPLVGQFLVPGDAPGVEIRETWDHLGMRASVSHDVLLHDVEVPLDHAVDLRPPGRAAPGALGGWLLLLPLAVYTGVARAARDWLTGYLRERTPSNLGAPLATLPRFQAAVGEIEALLLTNDRLLHGLAADQDAGLDVAAPAALAKVVVTGNVIKAVRTGLELIGNPGLSYHHPLQRHYRDALCGRIHTPQDDMVLTGAGRAALGI